MCSNRQVEMDTHHAHNAVKFYACIWQKETKSNCNFSRKWCESVYGQIFAWCAQNGKPSAMQCASIFDCVYRHRCGRRCGCRFLHWNILFFRSKFSENDATLPFLQACIPSFFSVLIFVFVHWIFLYNWRWWIPPKIWQRAQVWSCEQSSSRQQQRIATCFWCTHSAKEFQRVLQSSSFFFLPPVHELSWLLQWASHFQSFTKF